CGRVARTAWQRSDDNLRVSLHRQTENKIRKPRVLGQEHRTLSMIIVGVVEAWRDRATEEGKFAARLERTSLPDAARYYDLRTLPIQYVAADQDTFPLAVRKKLHHPHRVARVEVEDLVGRQAMNGGECCRR